LLLRMLGRDRKQKRAIEAFTACPAGLFLPEAVCASIEERLAEYRANLVQRSPLTSEDQELGDFLKKNYHLTLGKRL
jgi:hypothetical protein